MGKIFRETLYNISVPTDRLHTTTHREKAVRKAISKVLILSGLHSAFYGFAFVVAEQMGPGNVAAFGLGVFCTGILVLVIGSGSSFFN